MEDHDSVYVIHSVAREVSGKDGVQSIAMDDFLKDTRVGSLFILRLKKDQETRDSLSIRALHYLEKQVPFDYDFDHERPDKIYCSELLHRVLLDVTASSPFKTAPYGRGEMLLFNSILDSSVFRTVKVLRAP